MPSSESWLTQAIAQGALLRQATSFGLIGVINTIVGLSVFYSLLYVASFPPWLANFVGHTVAVTVSFFLNSKVTFKKPPTLHRALDFIVGFGISLIANLVVLHIGIVAGLQPGIAQLPAMVSYTVVFFLFSRYLVFR